MLLVNLADFVAANSVMAQVQAYAEHLRQQHQQIVDACTPLASRIAKPSYYGSEELSEPDTAPTVSAPYLDLDLDFDFEPTPPEPRRIGCHR
jgi:hypothetical protein